ncbi:hypothetical protein GCM10018793_24340 [Streptomyces sulfonofaciens]|uniref:Secreted protein n=1 Tax=Streptomyces sulfonofaciens TaxID=68272 RepID=A0A919G383_9ACTN|nr:hypothetical protein [Streptomyces sulfonofaciens]GHH77106.1 hypothetical protein GCM10018793_24340 [Streptomyces sulfonofaciens]
MANRGRALKLAAVLGMTALALTGFVPARSHGGHSHHSGGGGCSSSHQDHDGSSSGSGYGSSSTSGSSSGSSYGSSSTSGSAYGDDDDAYGSGGSTSGGAYRRYPTRHPTSSSSPTGDGRLKDAKVRLIGCATQKAPYATVELTNGNTKAARFWASVTFVDADGITVTDASDDLKVPAGGKATTRLKVGGEGLAELVDHCDVDPYATPVSD